MEVEEINCWSEADYKNGWCLFEQIGQPVGGSAAPENSPAPEAQEDQEAQEAVAEPVQPMTPAERRKMLQELSDKFLRLAHADPEGFLSNNAAQVTKLLDLAAKADEVEAPKRKTMADYCDVDLDKIPSAELRRIIIESASDEQLEIMTRAVHNW